MPCMTERETRIDNGTQHFADGCGAAQRPGECVEFFQFMNALPEQFNVVVHEVVTAWLVRVNVLIESKQVVRVVFSFEIDEPLVLLRAIRLSDPLGPFVHKKVHVRTACRELPNALPGILCPPDVELILGRVCPCGIDHYNVRGDR